MFVDKLHSPGCPKFSLPNIQAATMTSSERTLAASTSDVTITMKQALAKVEAYEAAVSCMSYHAFDIYYYTYYIDVYYTYYIYRYILYIKVYFIHI